MDLNMTLTSILVQIQDVLNYRLFTIQNTPITLMALFLFLIVLGATWFLSKYIPRLMKNRLVNRMDRGMAYTIQKILHYTILAIGFFVALETVGIDLSSLAIVAGFLGVGIGFGLQNITSNFVSGLILLFERPIKVGDVVTVGDEFGTVQRINMRATEVRTLDNIDIIIPNTDFVGQQVINWSHGEDKVRLRCPVGVAYGTDTEKVREVLTQVADDHPDVLSDPEPRVFFTEFGNSSLNFELRVWIERAEKQAPIKSDINFRIDQAFREAGIEIPFPQRDLHVRSSTTVPVQTRSPDQNQTGESPPGDGAAEDSDSTNGGTESGTRGSAT